MSKYTKPMTLRESNRLLAAAKSHEQQVGGWKVLFGFIGVMACAVVAIYGLGQLMALIFH